MKRAEILRGPVARASVRGRATGSGRRPEGYNKSLARVPLGRAGRCPNRPVLVIIDADDSGSVTGGNDPLGHRYQELAYALEKVGARCTCHKDLAAVVHFDVPTDADVPPTPISRKGIKKVKKGLKTPSRPASSNLGPALDTAYKFAQQYPDHDAVLVVATDFELFDSDLNAVLTKLVNFPGAVHALVLNTIPLQILTDSSNVTTTQVNPRSTVGDVAKGIFATITGTRLGAQPLGWP